MALDREDEYAFRKREIEALEAIGRAADVIVKQHEVHERLRQSFDERIGKATGEAPADETPPATPKDDAFTASPAASDPAGEG